METVELFSIRSYTMIRVIGLVLNIRIESFPKEFRQGGNSIKCFYETPPQFCVYAMVLR